VAAAVIAFMASRRGRQLVRSRQEDVFRQLENRTVHPQRLHGRRRVEVDRRRWETVPVLNVTLPLEAIFGGPILLGC
jgi:hypothetical protein